MKQNFKKVLSIFISILMLMQVLLPTAAFAGESASVCYIGSTGYESLAAAVAAATAGDTVWMTADDSVTSTVTIDKDLIIELDGHTLSDAVIRFSGNINVKLNDRVGTAKLNTNKNSGFNIVDYSKDSRLRAPFYLTGGANVTISGTTGGTEFYGGGRCTDGLTILEKAVVVGQGCHLTVNGGSLVYSGHIGTDGVFVCDTGIMTLNDALIFRYSTRTNGSSISYANVPTTENPLTIAKGHFYGGMWVEGSATINGVTISSGRLTFEEIEKTLLYTSEGSYIDYDKSKSTDGWEIYIASNKLSTDTDFDNAVDTTETLRVSSGGDVTADAGQKVVFKPQVTGGDGESEITYSWSLNGEDTGISTADYTIEAAASTDAGTYEFTATQGASAVSCTYNLAVSTESRLFSTDSRSNLLTKALDAGFINSVYDIKSVSFVDLSNYDLTGITTADYSADGDGSVLAWYDKMTAVLYIGGYGKIVAGSSLNSAFRNGEYINAINGLNMLDTSNVTDMAHMFERCGYYSEVFILDLGNNFDTSNVTDMTKMFYYCGFSNKYFILNLGNNFDTSSVTNMTCMFDNCGYNSGIFTLNLGNKFDTRNVTSMFMMFHSCGHASKAFTLDLGDKFDTSNVTNMSYMFYYCGYSSAEFTLDLGDKFNTSNVTNMSYMFCSCGYINNAFTLDLGDEFDTSNVTDMSYMFYYCGLKSKVFTLDLGSKFHTSKVKDMSKMFINCGHDSTVFTRLDLSGFSVSQDTKLNYFARFIPATEIIFGEGWNDAVLPTAGTDKSAFYCGSNVPTKVIGATPNLHAYDWAADNRTVTFADKIYYTVTATAGEGGTVSGGGTVGIGESVTLTAAANENYTFDGWYDGETKVCATAEFVVENVTGDKIYTAKFTYNPVVSTESKLFSTSKSDNFMTRAQNAGFVTSMNDIKGVSFVDLSSYDLTGITTADFSADGDGSVLAWFDEATAVLYIGGYGKIVAGSSLNSAFRSGEYIDAINGLNMLDTSNVTNMSYMFYYCGYRSEVFTLDLGNNFVTSNVTDMSYMFYYCGYRSEVFTLDLGNNFVTSNVTDMSKMFYNCGRFSQVFTLDLGNDFDTSNVTNMSGMFYDCGHYNKAFTLNLGNKFDTSNVTDMSEMFYYCGYGSEVFTLDLGDKFDTSNVTNMYEMFFYCGFSNVFTLNLGDKFDTSNVTDMSLMFSYCGYKSEVFTLDLGDKFNTSNVTNMSQMFDYCGYKSEVFTLDLGDKFDTSNVTDMSRMFAGCGYNSKVFTCLDLSGFNVSQNTNLDRFAKYSPATEIVFGEGWINAVLPAAGSGNGAFYCDSNVPTKVIGATPNLCSYDWAADNRTVTFADKIYYTVTATAGEGGTVSGGGTVGIGESVTLTAAANENYTFDGWYDGETKVCATAEFVVENVTGDKIYTAKFTYNPVVSTESKLFSTSKSDNFMTRAQNAGFVTSMNDIKGVSFVDLSSYDLTGITTADFSADGDGSVLAWFDEATAVLYIGGYGKIVAGSSLKSAFRNGEYIDAINGLNMLDTSNVTNMSEMFYYCGYRSEVFILDLGNNFVTSNVTDMSKMFYNCGYNSEAFTLNLGNNFDTSSVTNMSEMFYGCGSYGKAFTLNLGNKFDTSSVTNMYMMFYQCGYRNEVFTLDLGDKFDTSNVKEMGYMFYYCGYGSKVFTLDLGDKFDTSNVTNMSCMLDCCGHDSTVFTRLDLSGFSISKFTKLYQFARYIPATEIIFGVGWADASMPSAGTGAFYVSSKIPTKVTGATPNLLSYDWEKDNRIVTFTDINYYTITAEASEGGTAAGGGTVTEGGSVTLTAAANENYTFDGWYDGETKVCGTAEFVVENVTGDKTYTARFTQNTPQVPSSFDFTSIRTARANSIAVDHENKTISMNSDSGVKNVAIYHEQLNVIPGGIIRLADAGGTVVSQNSGSFYIINNAGNAEVLVDITIDNVTEQYTLTVNFSAFVMENLRMYQRKVGSSEKDIVYGTDVGYITGNTIYITTDPDVEYIAIMKHQGTPGNYNGIITPADDLPVYTTAEESLAATDYLYVDYQGCIFARKPADSVIAEFEINYELNGEVSVYKVIVDYSAFAEAKYDFNNIRAERLQGVEVDHTAKTIMAYAGKNVKNIAVYSYQAPVIDGGRITLADSVSDANIIKNANSFYIVNNGQEATTVPVNVQICGVTQQYELTVVFPDGFDFTDIRGLRTKNVVVDHENKTIELTSDGLVKNIAIYNGQTTVIPNGKITLADAGSAETVVNTGSFYINNIGNEQETVWVDISINGSVKRYSLTINFSDGFDFDSIRLLRAEGVTIDHAAKKIRIRAAEGAGNVAIYNLQTGVIANGRITLKDAMEASVKQNTGSFYILPPSEGGVSIITVDVTIGDKTETYEIEVSF